MAAFHISIRKNHQKLVHFYYGIQRLHLVKAGQTIPLQEIFHKQLQNSYKMTWIIQFATIFFISQRYFAHFNRKKQPPFWIQTELKSEANLSYKRSTLHPSTCAPWSAGQAQRRQVELKLIGRRTEYFRKQFKNKNILVRFPKNVQEVSQNVVQIP